ncbi:MAG TPA: ABC transporter substrate-binding protein [Acidimicrobiales bacterium]|nr:ABC transporter substrate-binding protein [Acidimicrobiales bacterium]
MLFVNQRKGRRLVSAAMAATLLTTSCGARVAPLLPTVSNGPSAAGGTSGGSSGPVASGSSGGGVTSGSSGGATSGTGGATTNTGGSSSAARGSHGSGTAAGSGSSGASGRTSGGGGTAAQAQALSPSTYSYNPQTQASYCTGTSGNTASAPGVTATSITAGNVSGITGAVSDSFTPGSQAVQAVFDSINRFGGICGRQLKLQVDDDQQNSSNDASDVQSLIPNVLAFVGDLSDADNGGVSAMEAAKAPDLGPAINVNRSNAPVYWSATGGSVTVKNGHAYLNNTWMKGLQQYGQMPKSIAVLSYSIPISAQAGEEYATVFKQLGVSLCYTNYSIPPAPGTVMGSVVASMQQKNCGGVFTTMDAVGNADMLQDMQSDGYKPSLISTTYEGYTPQQISLAGSSAAQNLDIGLSSVPLTAPVPGVEEYSQEMQTYEPGQPLTEFGLEAWADAELYVYALLKAGRNPTRASLTAALAGVSNWGSDGAFGAYTPSNRTGPPCITNVAWQGSAWKETWPSSGLYCSGTLVDVGPAS